VSYAERWFDIPEGSMTNPKRRHGNITKARRAVAYALKHDAGWSFPQIARLYNQTDHKSVLMGLREADKLLRTDPIFFDGVRRLRAEIAPL
jgi:chromosomal replication initiation ATPase DnaA